MSERKLTKTVISSKARNLIILKIQALKISPYGRNDKKRGFRSGTMYVELEFRMFGQYRYALHHKTAILDLYVKMNRYAF